MTLNALVSPNAGAKDPPARQTKAIATADSHHVNLLIDPMEIFLYVRIFLRHKSLGIM